MSRYETPEYQVLEKDGDIELRRYETYYTAAVEQAGLSDDNGFRQVFDFISGNNVSQEKIAMTIPVINLTPMSPTLILTRSSMTVTWTQIMTSMNWYPMT